MLRHRLRQTIRSFATNKERTTYPPYGASTATNTSTEPSAPPTGHHHFRTTHTIDEFRDEWNFLPSGGRQPDTAEGAPHAICVAGRIISKREASKKLYFLDMESNGSRIQVMSDERHFIDPTSTSSTPPTPPTGQFHNFRDSHKELQRGDIIGVSGFPARTNKGELSIVPRHMTWLAPCLRELPAAGAPPPQDPNVRFRQRAMDLISNQQAKQTLQVRFKVISLMRQYLEAKDFVEADTPILNVNAGGAAARPFTTTSMALGSNAPPLHLRIAPELYLKQLVVGGFDRVFEIGKVFRNEGIDSTHNPEFTTCEFYQGKFQFSDFLVSMQCADSYVWCTPV